LAVSLGAIKTKTSPRSSSRAESFEARSERCPFLRKSSGIIDFRGVQKTSALVVVRDEESGMEDGTLIPLKKT